MKKFLFICLCFLSLIGLYAQTSMTPRFGTTANQDNTGRVLTYGIKQFNLPTGVITLSGNSLNFYSTNVLLNSITGTTTVLGQRLTGGRYADEVTFVAKSYTSGTKVISFATLPATYTVVGFGGGVTTVTAPTFKDGIVTVTGANRTAVTRFIFDGKDYVNVSKYSE